MNKTLAGKTFYLCSVRPKPSSGPFPLQALASTLLSFAKEEARVMFGGPINHGDASFEISHDGALITFSDGGWTERGLGRVGGDDEQGTMRRRFNEAEDLLRDFSHGSFGLVVSDDANALTLKGTKTGRELTFKTEAPLCD